MPRVPLSPVEAQCVRLAQAHSGLDAARERFTAYVAPVLAAHGLAADARVVIDDDGAGGLVLVAPDDAGAA